MNDDDPKTHARIDVPGPPREPTFAQRVRLAPVTFALAAIDIVVFLLFEAKDSTVYSTGGITLLQVGANQRTHVLGGEVWRLASYMFLHVGWLHLLWNIYASVGFCMAVERALGRGRFLAIYLVTGVAGGIASAAWSDIPSAGASGALFGIVGAMLAIRRRQLPSFKAFFRDPPTRSTLINIAIWIVIGSTVLAMDNAAHLGGLASGFFLTWVLTARTARVFWRVAFAAAFGGSLLAVVRPWAPPRGHDLEQLTALSAAYLHGLQGFPKNVARGTRFADKACHAGSALACELLEGP